MIITLEYVGLLRSQLKRKNASNLHVDIDVVVDNAKQLELWLCYLQQERVSSQLITCSHDPPSADPATYCAMSRNSRPQKT